MEAIASKQEKNGVLETLAVGAQRHAMDRSHQMRDTSANLLLC
jgi:hypothetical protein